MSPSIDPGITPARRVAMARVKRATSQLVRWHSEYEDALTEAHDLGVPDRALADAGAPQVPAKPTPRTTAPSRSPDGNTSRAVEDGRSETHSGDGEPPRDAPQQRSGYGELRDNVPAEIRDVSFPTAVRGYDRRAVDAHVKRVNRVIAELEVSRSPQAAVRNALDRVGTQTSGILQRARETAEEITAGAEAEAAEIKASARTKAEETTARAQVQAEEVTGRAKAEAEEILARSQSEAAERFQRAEKEFEALREQADSQMRKLDADTKAIRQERQVIVDEIHLLAGRLEELASGATESTAATREDGEEESPEEQ